MGRGRESLLEGSEVGIAVFSRRDVDVRSAWFGQDNKENFCVSVDYASESLQRSPLPAGYPRSPLQDITGILSSLNQSTEAGKCGGHMRNQNQRRDQKKPSLQQLCSALVEPEASTRIRSSGQCTVMGSSEACPSGLVDFAAPRCPRLLLRSETPKQSTETSLLKLVTSKESDKEVADRELGAGSLHKAKIVLAARASTLDKCAEPTSPSSQRSKRRKPLAKLISGQNVPRFRSASSTSLFNQHSTTPLVWIMKAQEQDGFT